MSDTNIPPFFDAEMYKFLRQHIIEGMNYFISARDSSENKCLFCNEWESQYYSDGNYRIVHLEDCKGPKLLELCDLALAMFAEG